jgi:hypothetical protein
MNDPIEMHGVSTSLPDDLWARFEDERRSEDRNVAQHLRRIVREHFTRKDLEMKRERVGRPYVDPDGRSVGSVTVPRSGDPHQPYIGRDLAPRITD